MLHPLTALLREAAFCDDLTPQVDGALAIARAMPPHHAGLAAVRALEREAREASRLRAECRAWQPAVSAVIARVNAALANETATASIRYEQAQIGLAVLRASFSALGALSSTTSRVPIEALCSSLLSVVHLAIARQQVAERDLPVAGQARASAASLAEQDAVLPALRALGCGGVLSELRRQSLGGLRAAAAEAERCLEPRPASMDEALLLSTSRAACVLGGGEREGACLGPEMCALAQQTCARRWDECCRHLASAHDEPQPTDDDDDERQQEEAGEAEMAVAAREALLECLRWWRPLALGLPAPPKWQQRAGGAMAEAAVVHVQAAWRALRARQLSTRAARDQAEAAAAAVVSGDEGSALAARVLELRASLLATRDASSSLSLLYQAVEPVQLTESLVSLQRRLGVQLSALALQCTPLPSANAAALSLALAAPAATSVTSPALGSPRRATRINPPTPKPAPPPPKPPPPSPHAPLPTSQLPQPPQPPPPTPAALAGHGSAVSANGSKLKGSFGPASISPRSRTAAAGPAPATPPPTPQAAAAPLAPHAVVGPSPVRLVASERLFTSQVAAARAWEPHPEIIPEAAHEAAREAREGDSEPALRTAHLSLPSMRLPSASSASSADAEPKWEPNWSSNSHHASASSSLVSPSSARANGRRVSPPAPPPTPPSVMTTAAAAAPSPSSPVASASAAESDAAAAARAAAAAAAAAARNLDYYVVHGEGADGRDAPPSLARLVADAVDAGALLGAQAPPPPSPADVWWASHFGAGLEAVPFERLRAAAEVEMGALSSVDVQLLRLELSDDRGKLTRHALGRLLAGSINGSAGHATVPLGLRALLQSARAQLDRQVETRMRQAAASRGTAAASTPNRKGAPSPERRRVKLHS